MAENDMCFSHWSGNGKELERLLATINENRSAIEAKNEWKAGSQYNLGIVLNKTGIKVTGCEIQPWDEVNCGDTSAE